MHLLNESEIVLVCGAEGVSLVALPATPRLGPFPIPIIITIPVPPPGFDDPQIPRI